MESSLNHKKHKQKEADSKCVLEVFHDLFSIPQHFWKPQRDDGK